MFDFFATQQTGNLNYNEPNEPFAQLLGMPNEVIKFEMPKSVLQKKCINNVSIWWYKPEIIDPTCKPILNNWIEKAGILDLTESEKYSEIVFEVNSSLIGRHFSITSDTHGQIFSYLANGGDFADLLNQINESKNVIEATNEGNEITIKVCRAICESKIEVADGAYSDKSDAPMGLASIEVLTSKAICNCANNYMIEVKLPCIEGCYNLALRFNNEDEPFAMTIPVFVNSRANDQSVYITYDDQAFRILGNLRFTGLAYESTERNLSSGKIDRSGYKAYDTYKLILPYSNVSYQRHILQILNKENVKINGKSLYVKGFSQHTYLNSETNSVFELYDLGNILNTNNNCADGMLANIEVINHSFNDYEVSAFLEGKLVKIFSNSTFLADGTYCLNIPNNELTELQYNIVIDGLITENKGLIKAKCKKNIPIKICNCKNIKIILNEKKC